MPAADQRRPSLSFSRAAMPTSAHEPQLTLSAGRFSAAAMMGQGVEEGIGRGVVALARRTQQRRGRGKEDEQVERAIRSGRVSSCRFQAPCTLAAITRSNRSRVCSRSTPSSSTPARWKMPRSGAFPSMSAEHRGNLRAVADVALPHDNRHAGPFQIVQLRAVFVGHARSAQQDQVMRSAIDEPTGQLQPKPAQAAGDQVGAVLAENEGFLGRLAYGRGLDHHLADMFGPRHVPQGIDDPRHGEGTQGKRLQRFVASLTSREPRQHFVQQTC